MEPHIDETRYDFGPTLDKLSGGSTKEWRIYANKAGHMGCGPYTNPTEWWSAAPHDKDGNTIYDDRITFSNDYKYTYSSGEDGHIFVNTGVNHYATNPNNGSDYDTPENGMESTFELGYNAAEDVVTLSLPAGTLFPYIANDVQFSSGSTFRILDINNKTITLSLDLEGISWQFILVNGEDEAEEEGFNPDDVNWCAVDAAENLGAGFNTKGTMSFWWANAGWAQIGDPGFSFADGVYTIDVTENGGGEWQAQCTINGVPLNIEEEAYYDISCKLTASESIDRVTIKVNKDPDVDGDPNTLFYNGGISLKKGENTVRFAKIMAMNGSTPIAFDQAKFIVDLGGAPVGAQVSLSDIIIQKHNPK